MGWARRCQATSAVWRRSARVGDLGDRFAVRNASGRDAGFWGQNAHRALVVSQAGPPRRQLPERDGAGPTAHYSRKAGRSIRGGRFFRVVDNEDINRRPRRLECQAKLLLDRGENRWAIAFITSPF